MPGTPEDNIAWAVITLLDEAHHLPVCLIEELRKYDGTPDARPPKLAKQQNACRVLLDYAEDLPHPLEAEITAYAEELAKMRR